MQYTKEEKSIALSISLTSLAISMGYTVIRKGRYHSLQEMDSVIIYNDRTWSRWSQILGGTGRKGGTQIDFMLEFGGSETVVAAIKYLVEFSGNIFNSKHSNITENKQTKVNEMVLPEKSSSIKNAYAYLLNTRGLSLEVVNYFIRDKKILYESSQYHNLVFLGYDRNGEIKFASMRGTMDAFGKPFKGDVSGNDKNYGVNIVNLQNPNLKVFESAIDCMSYIDLYGDYASNKLILGMLHDAPLKTFLKEYSHISDIEFCLDNDPPGIAAMSFLSKKYSEMGYSVVTNPPPGPGKDFNELLIFQKKKHLRQ